MHIRRRHLREWPTQLALLMVATIGLAGRLCAEQPTATDSAALVAALAGEDALARFAAQEELMARGDEAVRPLRELATSPGDTPSRRYAINALAGIGTPAAVNALCEILTEDPNVMVRGLICQHLGRAGAREAVPTIGKWLVSIRGQSFSWGGHQQPKSMKVPQGWIYHAEALRDLGGAEAITILKQMLEPAHGGDAGKAMLQTYRQVLHDLKNEAAFWLNVRAVPGLEAPATALFEFFRGDTLALMRLHRWKVIAGGREGQWVLEDLKRHPEAHLRDAAAQVLEHYAKLKPQVEVGDP